MAPEVIQGKKYGWSADIWSLGCTVYEMCSGNPPWKDLNPLAAMNHIAHTEKKPVYSETISTDLKDFLDFCFVKNPKDWPNVYQLLHHKFITGLENTKFLKIGITKTDYKEYLKLRSTKS